MIEKTKKTSQNPSVSAARKGALELLHQLFRHPEDGTPLPVMLSRYGASASLDGRDAALLSELVYGVLRRHAALDAALAGFLKKPDALSFQVRMLLRLGAYEILFMDGIPARATVNDLLRASNLPFHAEGDAATAYLHVPASQVRAFAAAMSEANVIAYKEAHR